MSTGDKFVALQPKRIMGFQDFRERMLDHLKKSLRDFHEVAFGLDGVFDGPVTMSGFGANRIQLVNDGTWSDSVGHFLRTDVALAGRDVGLAFENTTAIVYDVALHYDERPRSVQINPRTGNPEFVAWEESIGNRADPTTVTDNGSNITFRVDSAANPFGHARTHAGRKCLVWKKTPGKLATTEPIAIEELIVVFGGGQNTVTTTGLLGQVAGQVSVNAADYYVMVLGPTITRFTERDLEVEVGYSFVGRVTGNAGTPVIFNLTGQNQLGSGFAVDLSAISRLDAHGDLKLRVIADGLDVNEPQFEIWDSGMTPRFTIDEDGDTYISGSVQLDGSIIVDQDATVDGTLDASAFRSRDAESVFEGALRIGADINAGSLALAATTPRENFGTLKPGTWNLIENFATPVAGLRMYVHGDDGIGLMFTANCYFNGTVFTADFPGREAYALCFGGTLGAPNDGLTLKMKMAADSGGTWTDVTTSPGETSVGWNITQSLTMGNQNNAARAELPRVVLGPTFTLANGGTTANALLARIKSPPTDAVGATWTLLNESIAPATCGSRIYVHANGSVCMTFNAYWGGALWTKDVNGTKATRFQLDSSNGLAVWIKEGAENTPWTELQWGPGLSGTPALKFDNGVTQVAGQQPNLQINTRQVEINAADFGMQFTMDPGAALDLSSNLNVGQDLDVLGLTSLQGAVTLLGLLTTSANIMPNVTNLRDLGSNAVRWNNIYAALFTGNAAQLAALAVTGTSTMRNILPDTPSLRDIGATGLRFANMWTDALTTVGLQVDGGANVGGNETVTGNVSVNGEFKYITPKSRTIRIAGVEGMTYDFTNWSPQVNNSSPGGVGLFKTGGGNQGVTIMFDQLVPHGAIVTGARIFTSTTGSSAGANEVRASLFRQNESLSIQSFNDGASGYDVITPHGSGSVVAFPLTMGAAVGIRTLDKTSYVYGCWVGARGASTPQIEMVEITYTLGELRD